MTTTDRTTAIGVFTERAMAEKAIEDLRNAGFAEDEIGFIAPQQQRTGAIYSNDPEETVNSTMNTAFPAVGAPGIGAPYAAGVDTSSAPIAPLAAPQSAYDTENDEDTGSGAATGAVSGGVLGGIIGAAAALLIPGFGPVIAGGILAATLGGAALGALAGGLVGALTHLGIPEVEANYYQDELNAGKTVITVHTPDRFKEAMAILRVNGATDASDQYTHDATAHNLTTPAYDNNQFVETVVPDYSNDQPIRTVPPIYDNDPSSDTTISPTAPVDTTLQTARTAAAVNTTTSDTSMSPQGAYTPTMPPIEATNEAEQHNREASNRLNTTPDERV